MTTARQQDTGHCKRLALLCHCTALACEGLSVVTYRLELLGVILYLAYDVTLRAQQRQLGNPDRDFREAGPLMNGAKSHSPRRVFTPPGPARGPMAAAEEGSRRRC